MTKYKHIFSDVDGTLIHTRNNVPTFDPNLIKRIGELNQYNIGLSIATGRHYQDVLMMLKKNNINNIEYVIGIAGAQIYDYKNKQLISNRTFDDVQAHKVKEIYDFLNTNYFNHFIISVFTHTDNNTDAMYYINNESKIFSHYIGKYVARMSTNIDCLNLVISKRFTTDKIYKVALYVYDKEFERDETLFEKVRNELCEKWGKYFDFVVCGPCYLEICMKNINKGYAIQYLLDNNLKLNTDDLICFGDSDNDIEMFQLIKDSVTRQSAPESTKKHAKYIIDNEPSTFVLEAIDKMMINKK